MPRPMQLHKLLGGGAVRSNPYSLVARNRRPLSSPLDFLGLTPYPENFLPETMVMKRSSRRRGTRSRSRCTRRFNRAHDNEQNEEQGTTGSTTSLRARYKGNDSSLSVEEHEENSPAVTLHTNPNFNVDISPSISKSNDKLNKKQSVSAKTMKEREALNGQQTTKTKNKQETADSGSKTNGSEDSLLKEYEIIERKAAEMYARKEKAAKSKQSPATRKNKY